ncbi:YhjD/YihY/BrkB family envelope integrity protein [Microlunatus sp. Gsoil 973]|uniref:YhjD/YihY/BrkB family envelope integrity protein n=1 Tax=Microlunatus sp. Gsoil 973 TaxID=2672569 RepID=UPI0012B4B98B|nr:YhjD/YihY/BrkB family envelope integrity protein [Microlunatus sp. Gsoil 973]QGN32763.1 tRNA-processing ribonuclease [Microlunatus sp. Gsoil 973]
MPPLKERVAKITSRPAIAHVLRANQRFGDRLGNQFGAAITYFSVLAVVPIIMFAFSILGFILVVVAPDLRRELLDQISAALSGLDKGTTDSIISVIKNALEHFKAIGIVGLLSALYSGAGWIGNLKDAVRAQWRESFDLRVKKENFLVKNANNIVILLGLLVLIGITFGLASISTSLSGDIVEWLGLGRFGWLRPVLAFVPIIFSVGAGWLVFMYLFLVLPETREPWTAVRRGALMGAIGLGILQYLTSFLIGRFAASPTAALFGPVIALMIFLNLFARLVLFVAAWIGTAEHAAEPDFAALDDHEATEEQDTDQDTAPERQPADPRGDWSRTPGYVSQEVATRTVQLGTGAGYLTGAATGAGLGALAALALKRLTGRRSSRWSAR